MKENIKRFVEILLTSNINIGISGFEGSLKHLFTSLNLSPDNYNFKKFENVCYNETFSKLEQSILIGENVMFHIHSGNKLNFFNRFVSYLLLKDENETIENAEKKVSNYVRVIIEVIKDPTDGQYKIAEITEVISQNEKSEVHFKPLFRLTFYEENNTTKTKYEYIPNISNNLLHQFLKAGFSEEDLRNFMN